MPAGSIFGIAVVAVLGTISLVFFFSGVYQRYCLVRLGREGNRLNHIPKRIACLVSLVLGQWNLLKGVTRSDRAGVTHSFIFWGGIIFGLGYFFFVFGSGFYENFALMVLGRHVSAVFSIVVDIFGALALIALIWGLIRRFVIRPERQTFSFEWLYFMGTIIVLLLTYFVMEALRIIGGDAASMLQFPVGVPLAHALRGVGFTGSEAQTWYNALWWLGFAVICGFLIHSRYSKKVHGIAAPFNIFLRSLDPKGALVPIGVETARTLTATTIDCLTWKELLNTFSCAECGRCQISCPAYLSGKVLNPKDLIQKLKEHLLKEAPSLLGGGPAQGKVIFGETVSEEAVWDCTTCGACQQQCPTAVEHVNLIVDLRRQLVERGRVTSSVRNSLENMCLLGNPWRESQTARSDFARQLGLPLAQRGGETELLYWVGCASAYDERARNITRAVASLLKKADIKYAVLGAEEKCCGDPARRLGDEGLFQMLARSNIETFKKYDFKRILVHCPHCYNTFRNEYRQFGVYLEVIHHSEFIRELIHRGEIIPSLVQGHRLTFHDPCYLGRYNGLYAAPRQVLRAIPGLEVVEMRSNRERSFCCGAGGGHLWMQEGGGQRIENLRFEQAQEVSPQVIATACPYCVAMLDVAASTKGAGTRIKVMDIAELVMEAMI